MARPERHDVDYFPFFIKDGKTLYILESKYGCKGTGFFTNLMRFLCRTPDHYFHIKNESDRMYLFATLKCDDVSGAEMLNIMAETGKIDKKLWLSHSVIVSQDLLESLKPAYNKRKNTIISIEEIGKLIVSVVNNLVTAPETTHKVVNNPQTKVKKSKEKKSKIDIPEHLKEIWTAYLEMRMKKKKPATEYAQKLVISQLEKWYPKDNNKQIECLNNSIKNSWTDVYELKNSGVGNKYEGMERDF